MFMSILKDAKIESKLIPYTTSAALSMALLGGHLDWKTSTLVSNMQYIKSGDMRPLVLTSRSPEAAERPGRAGHRTAQRVGRRVARLFRPCQDSEARL